MSRSTRFSISAFSTLTGLPVRTLRFYHQKRLLLPTEVDADTRYRNYGAEQIPRALRIATMRAAGLSLSDIRFCLQDPDREAATLQTHEARLRAARAVEDDALAELRAVPTGPTVLHRHSAEVTVVSASFNLAGADTPRAKDPSAGYGAMNLERMTAELRDTILNFCSVNDLAVGGETWSRVGPVGDTSGVDDDPALHLRVSVPLAGPVDRAEKGPGHEPLICEGLADNLAVETVPVGREAYCRVPTGAGASAVAAALAAVLDGHDEGWSPDPASLRYVTSGAGDEVAMRLVPGVAR